MKQKEMIYIPSLCGGAFGNALKKDVKVGGDIPYRFWTDATPEQFRYKYFLLSAGLVLNQTNCKQDWGLEDSVVFGDSGGFQFCTGAVKWDLKLRDKIFEWLEANSTIAANLDIPPRVTYEGRFQEALDISFDNFKYFEQKQSGKTKFLNIIQGASQEEFNLWYNTVKDLQFGGWALGGTRKLINSLYVMALFLDKKEFDKTNIDWIHILGVSKIMDLLVYSKIQHLLNIKYNNRITVSIDSSTPTQFAVRGNLITYVDWKHLSYQVCNFPKGPTYPITGHVPSALAHPGVPFFTWDIISQWSTDAVNHCTYHNTHMVVDATRLANEYVKLPYEALETILNKDAILVLKSLDEMFESDKPIEVYNQYKNLYMKFSGDMTIAPNVTQINTLFTF